MRIDLKLAVFRSGKRQWQTAQEANISKTRLSKYVNGYGRLKEEEKRRLEVVLGVSLAKDEVPFGDSE